jgi:hypothetical protein
MIDRTTSPGKHARRRMTRALALVLALAEAACATAQSRELREESPAEPGRRAPETWAQDTPEREGMPFVKLAKRELGVVVHFVGAAPSPALEETLEREIVRRLKTTYREPIFEYVREGAFDGFDSKLYLELAEKGVDDAVVVEAETDRESARLFGRVRIITLADERTVLDASLPLQKGQPRPKGDAAGFADRVWLAIAKNWTDPGAGPPLDRERVADRLARRGACDEAIKLYDEMRTQKRKPLTVAEAQNLDQSHARLAKCKSELALRESMERDKRAVFGVTVSAKGLAPNIAAAFERAIQGRGIRAALEALTNKPVVLEASPEALVLNLRFHPERYAQTTRSKPKFVMNERAIFLEVYDSAMRALSSIKDAAADALPPYDAPFVRKLNTTLRLTKLPDDRLEIDFADLDGRLLLVDTLHVKVGARPETIVRTPAKSLLHDHIFLIGPPHEVTGELTDWGLVYQFFEIE